MILYALACGCGAGFDAWFDSSDGFDRQQAAGQIACPGCGGADRIAKAPMAPRIGKGNAEAALAALHLQAHALRRHVEAHAEHVGADFPEEARRIHYGETEKREIWGEASLDQAAELLEEGIAIAPLPGAKTDA